MAKAKKQESNSKPGVKVRFFNLLLVLLGADIILLFAPDYGLIYSFGFMNNFMPNEDVVSWLAVALGLALLLIGIRGIYRKV
jgi:hypothetical protein